MLWHSSTRFETVWQKDDLLATDSYARSLHLEARAQQSSAQPDVQRCFQPNRSATAGLSQPSPSKMKYHCPAVRCNQMGTVWIATFPGSWHQTGKQNEAFEGHSQKR